MQGVPPSSDLGAPWASTVPVETSLLTAFAAGAAVLEILPWAACSKIWIRASAASEPVAGSILARRVSLGLLCL
jgi:hypothetical protein